MSKLNQVREAGAAQTAIIRRAQALLTNYLVPDSGVDAFGVINSLLELLDGPDQRAAQEQWDRASAVPQNLTEAEAEALNIGFNGVTILQSDQLPPATIIASPDVYALLIAQQEEQAAEENKPRIILPGGVQ